MAGARLLRDAPSYDAGSVPVPTRSPEVTAIRRVPPTPADTRAIADLFCGLRVGVWGLGFGVWGLGFGVWGLGCRVWSLGVGVYVSDIQIVASAADAPREAPAGFGSRG